MDTEAPDLLPILEWPDLQIPLSDGTVLSARVWLPRDAATNSVPAILEFLPYRKRDGTVARDSLTHPWFAKRGYACVRVDMRGNGDSDGLMEDEYAPQEQADAVEVIAWLAAQEWCSGTVGMMGISWGGFNALQVAALQPPALKAIITLCSTADRYADDIHYKGGCLLNENLGWGSTMWSYSSRAPDPVLRPDTWRDTWLQRLDNEPFLPAIWLRHQRRDDYWKHGSICEDYSAIKAATLALGGWGDAYKNTVPLLVENLSAPVKGIVGPWVHKYPHFAVPEPRIGFLQEAKRWWDKWLKGIETGVEADPDYTAYLMDGVRPARWYTERSGIWIAEPEWPSDNISTERLALSPGGVLDGDGGPLSISVRSPANCGMEAGEYCAIWLGPEMPGDQRGDDALSACFDTAPLAASQDVVGAPRLRLSLSSDKPNAQIAVRLNHVHPDGASTRITYGVLNLTHRNGHETPSPIKPGEKLEIELDLDQIAYRVPEGHQLRVAISSAYWPLIWPAPESATLTLHDGELMLPVRPATTQDERQFPPPDAETAWLHEVIRPVSNKRRAVTDLNTGVVTLEIVDDFGEQHDLEHGLTSGGVAREWWSIHPDDPLSARGRTHWTQTMSRDEIRLRTEAHAEMWCDEAEFHLTGRLEAFENEQLVRENDVSFSIPRDHL